MADIFLDSVSGSDANDGSTRALAKATLAAALTAAGAGGRVGVKASHAETQASAMTLTSAGTAASPQQVLCIDWSSDTFASNAVSSGATVSTTGSNTLTFGAGYAYVRSITFNATNSTGTGNLQFSAATVGSWILDSCGGLKLVGSGSTNQIIFGPAASGNPWFRVELINTPLSFANAGQKITVRACELIWRNTASAIGGTVPTTLMTVAATTGVPPIQLSGLDFSAAGSGKNLIDASIAASYFVQMSDCKLGASVAITTGSISGPAGAKVRAVNCDSADTNYRYYMQTYQGTITNETTIVKSSTLSTDGTTPLTWKMVTTANSRFYSPLESDWMPVWVDAAASKTVTVSVITDNVTLTDAECWVEVRYQGDTSHASPLGIGVNDRCATILTTPANQASDAGSTWTTTGLGTPVKQALSVTFTTTGKGLVWVRVCLAKASTTVYVDAAPVIT